MGLSGPPNGIAAGQVLISAPERSRSQKITLALSPIDVLPMTSHVEVVATVVRADADLR